MKYWYLIVVTGFCSLLLTSLFRRYALARRLLDVPNDRSSHTVPVPRGGGVAIVVTFMGCLFLMWIFGVLATPAAVGISGAGAWVALVGFIDDNSHIHARWRLLAHFLGAVWALALLGGLPTLLVFGLKLNLGWVGHFLSVLYLVWLLNLYNFMDGIDGIASVEAVTVCLGGALVYVLAVPEGAGWLMPVLLLAAVAGFLFWNFPHAKIFMGDAGSGFLGMMLGVFSIYAANAVPSLLWCWVILLGVFIVDATVTLFRRILRGEKFYEAHRSHAYQFASRKYGAHWPVSLAVGLINIFWLLPISIMVAVGWLDGVVGVMISYGLLIWLALRFNAGAAELQNL